MNSQALAIAVTALRYIAPEMKCESFTSGIGSCFRNGHTVDAEYTSDRCCDSCIAHDALERINKLLGDEALSNAAKKIRPIEDSPLPRVDEVDDWHIKICPTCKKEICPNCVVHFELSIRKVEPNRANNGLFGYTVHARPGYDIGLDGTYCSACGNDIERNLIAAGLQKKEKKIREDAVTIV